MYTNTGKLKCLAFYVQSTAYLTKYPPTFHVAVLNKKATVLKLLHRSHRSKTTLQDSQRHPKPISGDLI